MLKLPYLLVVICIALFFVIQKVNCTDTIADVITKYYGSELHRSFKSAWEKYKISYEHAIAEALKQDVGSLALNVFARYASDPRFLIAGNFFDDKIVSFEVEGMTLREMPRLMMPSVALAPASHRLRLESTLTKMFIDTRYSLRPLQAYNRDSPFAREHLRNDSLTIIAEDCILSGFAITTLVGNSLNVGHKQFLISDCKFSVEITPQDSSLPPVIKPYFDKQYAKNIEKLLTWAFLVELKSSLQGALYTLVNTTEVFGDDLKEIRAKQQKLFTETNEYMIRLCEHLNNKTLETSKGQQLMDTKYMLGPSGKKAMLYGLDTVYAAGDGGSFEAPAPSVAEAFRFRKMQIRSERDALAPLDMQTNDFAAELTDVTVNVILEFNKDGSFNPVLKFAGWRVIDFSSQPKESDKQRRNWMEGQVTHQLLEELEKQTTTHLSSMLQLINKPNSKLSLKIADADDATNVDSVDTKDNGLETSNEDHDNGDDDDNDQ